DNGPALVQAGWYEAAGRDQGVHLELHDPFHVLGVQADTAVGPIQDDAEPLAWNPDREQRVERLGEVLDAHDVEHRHEADGVRQVEAGQGEVRIGRRGV